ncbi:small s protein [Ophiostoma piceae UAMH 11346]|uniref:Small s protein n=1 Tax=Ophiostoma piceae (strain UAMH 11346) TaxID=1262450 RepID=S3CDG8_OPHP1|nr:small s protein [Ophiostoma piceae UAMH 11346]
MLDPLTVVELASRTYKAIEFAIDVVTDTIEVYKSPNGMTNPDAHMGTLEEDLDDVSSGIVMLLSPVGNTKQLDHVTAIVNLAGQAQAKCEELKKILGKLKVRNESSWRVAHSLKVVLASLWKRKDVKGLHADLQDFRTAIVLRLNMIQIEENFKLNETLADALEAFQQRAKRTTEVEHRVCERIRNKLHFKSIHEREDGIRAAEDVTLKWLFAPETTDHDEHKHDTSHQQVRNRTTARLIYESWLRGQNENTTAAVPSILHFSGKAGSGKSTLMRHLYSHSKTTDGLRNWAGDRKLIQVSFYFWATALEDLQKSLQGLYRTVLYQALGQYPELGAYLFTDQWSQIQSRVEQGRDDSMNFFDEELMRPNAIKEGFDRLVGKSGGVIKKYCVGLFVDGLDEYAGEHDVHGKQGSLITYNFKQLVTEILSWGKAENVKICVSSRPYADFLQKISGDSASMISLHNLNINDIRLYCQRQFEENEDIDDDDVQSYTEMSGRIAIRSDGVFLWAFYMVKVIMMSYENGDSPAIRLAKLGEVEPNLNAMYDHMLSKVPETERRRSNAMLNLILVGCLSVTALKTVWALWVDDLLGDADFPSLANYHRPYDAAQRDKKLLIAHKRMSLWTCSLLIPANDGFGSELYKPFHRTAIDYLYYRRQSGTLETTLNIRKRDLTDRLFLAEVMYFGKYLSANAIWRFRDNGGSWRSLWKLAKIMQQFSDAEPRRSIADDTSLSPNDYHSDRVRVPSYFHRVLSKQCCVVGETTMFKITAMGLLLHDSHFFKQYGTGYDDLLRSLPMADRFSVLFHYLRQSKLAEAEQHLFYIMDADFHAFLESTDTTIGHPFWAILIAASGCHNLFDSELSAYDSHALLVIFNILLHVVPRHLTPGFDCHFSSGGNTMSVARLVALRTSANADQEVRDLAHGFSVASRKWHAPSGRYPRILFYYAPAKYIDETLQLEIRC